MTFLEKLTKMEKKKEDANHAKAVELLQECVVVHDKSGSLKKEKLDVGSDDVNNTVNKRKIISRIKPDLLS